MKQRDYVCYILNINEKTLDSVLSKSKYHSFQIPKRSGGVRTISAPDCKLKWVQERINQYILKKYQFLDCQYGFIPKRSIVDNAKVHVKASYILNIDLKDFFPSIHFGRVRGIFMAEPFRFTSEVATILARLACYHNSLPQGSPCSPSISNIVCYRLDEAMLKLSKQYHFHYTRYADDITISADQPLSKDLVIRTKDHYVILGKKLRHIIESQGFIVNETKTSYSWNRERKEVTGLIVNEKVNIKKVYIKQLRALLDRASKDDLYRAARYYFKVEKNYDCNYNNHQTLVRELCKVIEGKLNFIAMVRGQEDLLYQKYLNQYLSILYQNHIYSSPLKYHVID